MNIKHDKVILSTFDKLEYFSISLISFGVFIFMLIINFNDYIKNIESNILFKISLIFLIIGIASLIIRMKTLKLIEINHSLNIDELKNKFYLLSQQQNWEIITFDKEKIIFITKRRYNDRYLISPSSGEKIYIYYSDKQLKFKSIINLEYSVGIQVIMGENKENENIILNYL